MVGVLSHSHGHSVQLSVERSNSTVCILSNVFLSDLWGFDVASEELAFVRLYTSFPREVFFHFLVVNCFG